MTYGGNPPTTGRLPSQSNSDEDFDIFFAVNLNELLNKW